MSSANLQSGDATPPDRPCPYCGASAVREVEESPGEGVLGETFSVCMACGHSMSTPRWTQASTRRAFLLAARTLGSVMLVAIAAWLLAPFLWRVRMPTSGST